MDVMAELKPIGLLYKAGDWQTGLRQLQSLWNSVPEPKTGTLNAYLIVEYGVAFSLAAQYLDQAQDWADRAPTFAAMRQDMGEVEFLLGRVAFARGEIERAKEQFLVADAKSEGRAFQGKDERYRQLIDRSRSSGG